MTSLDDLMQAALLASPERKREALGVLRGESVAVLAGTSPSEPAPYLTLKEVARRLGVNPATLWRWQIPGHDLGGRRRFKLPEVVAYLESDTFKRQASALRATRRALTQKQNKEISH